MEMKTFEDILAKARKELFALTGNQYTIHAIPSREKMEYTVKAVDPSTPEQTEFFREVVGAVCKVYDVDYDALVSKSRSHPLPEARGMIFYILNCNGWTQVDIGRAFGGRDHSTVNHRLQTHRTWVCNNSDYRKAWADAKDALSERGWQYVVVPGKGEVFLRAEECMLEKEPVNGWIA